MKTILAIVVLLTAAAYLVAWDYANTEPAMYLSAGNWVCSQNKSICCKRVGKDAECKNIGDDEIWISNMPNKLSVRSKTKTKSRLRLAEPQHHDFAGAEE